MPKTIKDYIRLNSTIEKDAVVEGENSITYSGLYRRANIIAEKIKSIQSNRCHIAIVIPNSIDYVVAFSAVVLSDNVVVPIYAKSSIHEIEKVVDYCDIGMIIAVDQTIDFVLSGKYRHRITVLNISKMESFEIGDKRRKFAPVSPENVRVMLGTSGSVDFPKRVMLSDENLIANSKDIIKSLNYTENERILAVLPFPFAAGNTSQIVVSLILGSTLYIYSDSLYPDYFFNAVEKYGITSTTIVSSVMNILLEEGRDYSSQAKTLNVICFGGGRTDDRTFDRLKKNPLCDKFVHIYGQTEASPRISHLFLKTEKDKLPSVGKSLDNVSVRLRKMNLKEQYGEIQVKGKNVMVGYYKSDSFPVSEGWLSTGDLGYIDEEGYIYITGRIKNLIIFAGMNIFPEEVEVVLKQNPHVKEALVYAERSLAYGEIPVARVALKDNGSISEAELKEFCKEYVSYYKVPVRIEFVEKLDRTHNGKIKRKV